MQLTTLRQLVAAAIALLLVHQAGVWIAALFGNVWGVLAAAGVAVLAILALRLARQAALAPAWLILPVTLLIALPVVAQLWQAFTDDRATWVERVISVTPLLIGFVAPVAILLVVYGALRHKTAIP